MNLPTDYLSESNWDIYLVFFVCFNKLQGVFSSVVVIILNGSPEDTIVAQTGQSLCQVPPSTNPANSNSSSGDSLFLMKTFLL